ncbi:MAG: NAD+ synthase [SAR86 cluster bacterium]|uniref:Glutamine-dependent NAD(+) synthetase n=1 Tax=SAR86 cluster bacterium TaxID=2030880 RepID=A0A2A5AET1_9GAMM|nr:MAG: NAD+ synthase [SAR86 cluster bacterium]
MARQINVVMAQLNFVVGDIESNTTRLIESAKSAMSLHAADIIAFPELCLTGYPPEDLLLRPSMQIRIEKAISTILEADIGIYIVLGYPEKEDSKLYNALMIIKGRECLASYRKQCLPNYQVFDERRYFDHGDSACVLNICGANIAFTICEDMWERGPIQQARDAGAQLMININASPYHKNKPVERQQLLKERAADGGFPIIYVNLIGGQDELVFDGGSMAMTASGNCHYLAPSFEEGLFPVSINIEGEGVSSRCNIPLQCVAASQSIEAQVYQCLVLGMRDYADKNKFAAVILGLSGGIDSALTLAIAVDALGKDRVHAVMMPFEYTSQLSLDAAQQQAQFLGVDYKSISIEKIYESFITALESEFANTEVGVSEQNIQARCRGVLLMAISNKKGFLVLTTGNKSEIAVGYSTLYGDMAGGFDALKDVSKTLVYRLAAYRNMDYSCDPVEVIPQQVIDRPPSAELAPDQVDQDSLPPYDQLDRILELYIEEDCSAEVIIRQGFESEVVKKILRLVDLNEYKRRQSPIGVRLTKRGFGRDRRYPITNAWPLGE